MSKKKKREKKQLFKNINTEMIMSLEKRTGNGAKNLKKDPRN
jgi:hypothetical protein